MSIAINQDIEPVVRSYDLRIDYAGERDHTLVELSDVLPSCVFESGKIN